MAQIETRRRIFWSAYAIDTQLGITIGQLPLLLTDGCDVQIPSCVDDDEVDALDVGKTAPMNHKSEMFGPIAHIKYDQHHLSQAKDALTLTTAFAAS